MADAGHLVDAVFRSNSVVPLLLGCLDLVSHAIQWLAVCVVLLYGSVALILLICSASFVPQKSSSSSALKTSSTSKQQQQREVANAGGGSSRRARQRGRSSTDTPGGVDASRSYTDDGAGGDDLDGAAHQLYTANRMRAAHHSLPRSPRMNGNTNGGASKSSSGAARRLPVGASMSTGAGGGGYQSSDESSPASSSVVTWLGRYPTCHVTGGGGGELGGAASYELSDDFQQRRTDALERKYGGRVRAQRAATVVQRAWRDYAMARKWRQVKDPAVRRRMQRFQTTSYLCTAYHSRQQQMLLANTAHHRRYQYHHPHAQGSAVVYAQSNPAWRGTDAVPPSVLVSPRMPRHRSPAAHPPPTMLMAQQRQMTSPQRHFTKTVTITETSTEAGERGEIPEEDAISSLPFSQALNLHKYAVAPSGGSRDMQPQQSSANIGAEKAPPASKVNQNSASDHTRQREHQQPSGGGYSARGVGPPPGVSVRPSVQRAVSIDRKARAAAEAQTMVANAPAGYYPQILSRESEVFLPQSPVRQQPAQHSVDCRRRDDSFVVAGATATANSNSPAVLPPALVIPASHYEDNTYSTYIRNHMSDASLGLVMASTNNGGGLVSSRCCSNCGVFESAPPPACCRRQQRQQPMTRYAASSSPAMFDTSACCGGGGCYADLAHNCSVMSAATSSSCASATSSPVQSPVWVPRGGNEKVAPSPPRRVAIPPPGAAALASPPRVTLVNNGNAAGAARRQAPNGDRQQRTPTTAAQQCSSASTLVLNQNGVGRTFETELERRRQYRIALNFFNKKPDRGMQYLINWRFVEPTPYAVAKFLMTKRGLSKQMIGEFLGNTQNTFNLAVLDCFADEIDLMGLEVDVALRKFLTAFRLPGEAQKIELVMEVFARRFCDCNPSPAAAAVPTAASATSSSGGGGLVGGRDTVFILAFAIVMLNTDLHSPNIKPERRMKPDDFVKNLRGVDDGHDIAERTLAGIYQRVREQQFRSGNDHVAQVVKVDRSIFGKKPKLSVAHRRLVCYCRLHEVNDQQKKQPTNAHQREVFLFNDLIVITKILSRKKNNVTYTYRQSLSLVSMQVHSFRTNNYPYGIRVFHSLEQKTLLFNARSQEDQLKFMEDLKESIKESDEMEALRIAGEMERQQQQHVRAADLAVLATTATSGNGATAAATGGGLFRTAGAGGVDSQRDSGLPDLQRDESASNLVRAKALSNSMLELVADTRPCSSASQPHKLLNVGGGGAIGGAAVSTTPTPDVRERRSSINSFDSGMSSTASVESRESSPKTADGAAGGSGTASHHRTAAGAMMRRAASGAASTSAAHKQPRTKS